MIGSRLYNVQETKISDREIFGIDHQYEQLHVRNTILIVRFWNAHEIDMNHDDLAERGCNINLQRQIVPRI